LSDALKGKALRLLARREHSRAELARKLASEGSLEEIASVLDQLEQAGLLSDRRFAEALVFSRAARFGAARLRHDLKARGVAEEIYKSRTVVKDVSFEVKSGEVVGLLGPNGAGKTTCFYMIVGLVGRRRRRDRARRRDADAHADPPPGAARPVLPAAGSLGVPQAQRGGEHPRRARAAGSSPRSRSPAAGGAAGRPAHRPPAREHRPSPSPAASGAASRSPGRWPPARASSCSTSPSPASTRSPCSTSRRSSASSRSAASAC
jgi:energy-coupling factor transporter ATP-binding protein EcfA2